MAHPLREGWGITALRGVGLWDRLELIDYIKHRYAHALDEVPPLLGENRS
ncbi:MAG: hypothetical protein LC799_10745 [Actinobacteria bacterium]|nr:hypothetical protein [Actinomycetota bacterium]